MPSLSQSPVLQALGYAIANSLWQMALVWIVFVLLNSVFKFKSEIKFRIAVAAQVTGFAWFIVTLQFYYRQCSQAVQLAESIVYSGGEQPYILSSTEGSLLNWFIQAEQLLPYLSVAYLLLLAFLVIRWFRAYRYTQLVRLNGLHKIHVDWKLFVTKVAGQLGIKPKVRIFLSEIVKSPVTIGFLKPVILIPIASVNHLTAEQMEAVILHELAHIKRHDYLLNIVLSIIELGLFFNPFTRLINKSISKERENSCDDWVLQYQYNPSMYAQALLQIAVLQHQPTMAMYAAKSKSELVSRVQRMVHQKDSRFNYRHQLVALLLMTGILASIAWFDPATMRKTEIKPAAEAQPVMLEPMAARIKNPLFNPVFFLNKPLQEEAKKTLAENEKRTRKLERILRTETREIVIPHLYAPVVIDNLSELEEHLASVNEEVRGPLQSLPARLAAAQGKFFRFDTAAFHQQFTTTWNGENWQKILKELTHARQSVDQAFRNGHIPAVEVTKIKAQIAETMRRVKENQENGTWPFAPGDMVWVEKPDPPPTPEVETGGRPRVRVTDGNKRKEEHEKRIQEIRLRKPVNDSIRLKLRGRTRVETSPPPPPVEEPVQVFTDPKLYGKPAQYLVHIPVIAEGNSGPALSGYTFVYGENSSTEKTATADVAIAPGNYSGRRIARVHISPAPLKVKKTASCNKSKEDTEDEEDVEVIITIN